MKRLNHLESMARSLEVMQNVDLNKIIKSLVERDEQIKQISQNSCESHLIVQALYKASDISLKAEKAKTKTETQIKEAALVKMDELRKEL